MSGGFKAISWLACLLVCCTFVCCSKDSNRYTVAKVVVPAQMDVLFVLDNSGDMVAEERQLGEAFGVLAYRLFERYGSDYHVGVITSSMESPGCPLCSEIIHGSCQNETCETGRLQDRLGYNQGTDDNPDFIHETNPACPKVLTHATKDCFYNTVEQKGFAMVGTNGCGYERGLAAIRPALDQLAGSYNAGFLRQAAGLTVIQLSNEVDCGEIGDVTEGLGGIAGSVCYYAANGADPEGGKADPEGKPYALTPLSDYYDFLMNLKDNKPGMVKFAAIVGVKDLNDLSTTTIEFFWDASHNRYLIEDACQTPDCSGAFCYSEPSPRYIALARMFGIKANGFVDTICQSDYSESMQKIGELIAGCPHGFVLTKEISDPTTADILINDVKVPRYSCSVSDNVEACQYSNDPSCTQGSCVATWTHHLPSTENTMGRISLADHFNTCDLVVDGVLKVEVAYDLKEDN
ncbi:MAG: hypothetical protein JRJ19_10345 [Deltaproteobacteria bacterium]|nr:hypothetical protein [Deltaproteobacteria bacterium]